MYQDVLLLPFHFAVPSLPQNFSLSPVAGSPTELFASWSVPIPRNGIITGYSVYCNTSANQTYPEQVIGSNVPTIRSVVNGTTLATTLTGLYPYTQYSCYVTANTSVGEGNPSIILPQRTEEAGVLITLKYTSIPHMFLFPAPPPPFNLTAYNDSSTAITLNWARPQFPNGLIQFYEVVYYPDGYTNGAINTTTPNTTLTINGLAYYTLYLFNVSVVTGGGTSTFSGPISRRTSEDGRYLILCMMKVTAFIQSSPIPSHECDGVQHQFHLHHGYLATTTGPKWHYQNLPGEFLCFRRAY